MKRKLAIVLASGGIDSCATIAYALQDYRVALLHVNYGQRTEKRELKAFNAIADFYGIKDRLVVDLIHLRLIGGSSLTDKVIPIPEEDTYKPSTYVPFRNANLLACAVSWAEVIGAEKIFYGAITQDAPGYPDCRKEFVRAFNDLIKVGTQKGNIEIIAPFIDWKKSDVIKKAVELGAPIHLTWSCYKNEDIACGKCPSCKRRLDAFREAGIEDPIPYECSK